ncbi:MAG: TPM domain-containing protein [Bacteroidia bacterium]|nr:TPM domain-containing protein [Bacteroidia bacterium]
MKVKEFIGKEGNAQIVAAIKQAELNTSGEIRVHIESKCKSENPVDRAVRVFNFLKMYNTKERNGVLVYVAVESKKFAIIGDTGINNAVPADFWDKIKEQMRESFIAGEYVKGLTEAIKQAGVSLKEYFPYSADDVNEQSDEISFGE